MADILMTRNIRRDIETKMILFFNIIDINIVMIKRTIEI